MTRKIARALLSRMYRWALTDDTKSNLSGADRNRNQLIVIDSLQACWDAYEGLLLTSSFHRGGVIEVEYADQDHGLRQWKWRYVDNEN